MNPPAPKATIKEILETVIDEMVDKGIFWTEAQQQFEKLFLIRALRQSRGNLCRAAQTMGLHRNTLTKKLREFKLDKKSFRR